MNVHFPLFLLLLLPCAALSNPIERDSTRRPYGFTVAAGGYGGVFVKHSPKLTTRTGQRVPGGEISVQWQTDGRHNWQRAQHWPAAGVALVWQRPGAGAHGHVVGLLPHLTLYWARKTHWKGCFRVGTGLAYAQRPHHSFSNPNENALGSHFNNVTQFQFGVQLAATPRYQIHIGGLLTHFSNGGYELPNFGMNIPGLYARVAYQARQPSVPNRSPADKRPQRRWGAAVQAGAAQTEYVSIDGPRYLVWAVSGAVTYRVHRYNRVYAGFEIEHNQGVEDWLYNNTLLGNDRENARQGARRWGIFAAEEFLFGPLGIYLQASWHVGPPPVNTFVIGKNYNKLAARYYFNCPFGLKTHLGVSLKAYKAVAESISLTTGLVF